MKKHFILVLALIISIQAVAQDNSSTQKGLSLLPQGQCHSIVFLDIEKARSSGCWDLYSEYYTSSDEKYLKSCLPQEFMENTQFLMSATYGKLTGRDKLKKKIEKLKSQTSSRKKLYKNAASLEKKISRERKFIAIAGVDGLSDLIKKGLKGGNISKNGEKIFKKPIFSFYLKLKFARKEVFAYVYAPDVLLISDKCEHLERMILVGNSEDSGLFDDPDYDVFTSRIDELNAKWKASFNLELLPATGFSEREINQMEQPGREFMKLDNWKLESEIVNEVKEFFLLEKHASAKEQKKRNEPLSVIKFMPTDILKIKGELRSARKIVRKGSLLVTTMRWDSKLLGKSKIESEKVESFFIDKEKEMMKRGKEK